MATRVVCQLISQDDDDEDDVIDFGGDPRIHPPPPVRQPPPPSRPQPPMDQPVSKSERFAEDFDRSWPRSAQQAVVEEAPRPPDLRKRESDRVLFNASSNRLETPSSRPQPTQPPQPTRLMSRTEVPSAASADSRGQQRQPPPHLANAHDSTRQPPPHMADNIPSRPPPPSAHQQQSGRIPWSSQKDTDRQLPPHMAHRPDLPPQSSAFATSRSPPSGPGSALPPRRSFGQATATNMAHPPQHTAPQAVTGVADPTESQAAEMHSAAEKARLRREAEEVERKAAAERAKQKAREMEARLGLSSTPRSTTSTDTPLPPQPPQVQQTPSYTIAQRPKPPAEAASTPSTVPSGIAGGRSLSTAGPPATGRPPMEKTRSREDQWRARDTVQPQSIPAQSAHHDQSAPQPRIIGPRARNGRPTAESFFEKEPTPPQLIIETPRLGPSVLTPTAVEVQALFDDIPEEAIMKKDYMFDDTLARIKAAMGASKPSASDLASSAEGQDGRRRLSETLPAKPTVPVARAAPPPMQRASTPENFSISQPELPRSPPPAWRTYVVKLPKESKAVPVIPQPQLSALKRTRNPAQGWLMSFNPPLELPQQSFSRTDMLLPPPNSIARRSLRSENVAPMVSISQGSLEPVSKKDTRPSPRKPEVGQSPVAATGHQQQSRSAGRWRQTDEAALMAPEPISTQADIDLLDAPPPKAKSPVKPVQTSESSDRYDAVGMGPGPAAKAATSAAAAEPQSGVRFMVSSELEGDSLLDEVNKMSLETVEEAGIKAQPLGNAAGIEVSSSDIDNQITSLAYVDRLHGRPSRIAGRMSSAHIHPHRMGIPHGIHRTSISSKSGNKDPSKQVTPSLSRHQHKQWLLSPCLHLSTHHYIP